MAKLSLAILIKTAILEWPDMATYMAIIGVYEKSKENVDYIGDLLPLMVVLIYLDFPISLVTRSNC